MHILLHFTKFLIPLIILNNDPSNPHTAIYGNIKCNPLSDKGVQFQVNIESKITKSFSKTYMNHKMHFFYTINITFNTFAVSMNKQNTHSMHELSVIPDIESECKCLPLPNVHVSSLSTSSEDIVGLIQRNLATDFNFQL